MDNTRKFLDRVLSSGMECGVVTPEGILRQVTPAMLALNLPKPLLASLIKAGLKNKSFDADLIVEVLGVRAIASYMPISALWRVVAEAADTLLEGEPPVASKAASDVASKKPADKSKAAKDSKADKADKDSKADKADKDSKADKSGKAKAESAKADKASKGKAKASKSKKKGKAAKEATPERAATVPEPAAPLKVPPGPEPSVAPPTPEPEPAATMPMPQASVEQEPAPLPQAPVAREPAPLPGVPEAPRKPNLSSRPETAPGLVARADAASADVTATTDSLEPGADFDVEIDTKVNSVPDGVVGSPPPRAPTFDPEVESALEGLEMDSEVLSEDIIIDEFEIAEDDVLDESVHFDDVRGRD